MTIQTLSLFVGPLLDQYANADSAHRHNIDNEIWQKYGREMVVLALDMSGFSQLTQRHGIVHYLAMVRRMQRVVAPVIADNGGAVVKFEADNCLAVFGEPLHAVRAAQAIHAALATQDHPDMVRVSIGIDSGKVLVVDNLDVFGNAVNRAAKLGEDVAEAGETLVTVETYALLPKDAGITGKPMQITVSGIQLDIISI